MNIYTNTISGACLNVSPLPEAITAPTGTSVSISISPSTPRFRPVNIMRGGSVRLGQTVRRNMSGKLCVRFIWLDFVQRGRNVRKRIRDSPLMRRWRGHGRRARKQRKREKLNWLGYGKSKRKKRRGKGSGGVRIEEAEILSRDLVQGSFKRMEVVSVFFSPCPCFFL